MTPTDALARFAMKKIVPEPVTGAAETAATFLTGAVAPWTGAAYGAYKNITEGKNERIDQPKFGCGADVRRSVSFFCGGVQSKLADQNDFPANVLNRKIHHALSIVKYAQLCGFFNQPVDILRVS